MKAKKSPPKSFLLNFLKMLLWFSIGAFIGLFFFSSFVFIVFQKTYSNVVYPGVSVNGINFGGKTEKEVHDFFQQKNTLIQDSQFIFKDTSTTLTISAKQINLGYDSDLIAKQVFTLGRSPNIFSNITLIFQAYIQGVGLPPSYRYSEENLMNLLSPIIQKAYIAPVDALFTFDNGRVTAFRLSSNGQEADVQAIKENVSSKIYPVVKMEKPINVAIPVTLKVLKPKISTDEVNNLGIKEIIGSGTSLFKGSIPNRIHNISLAASKLNGLLVAPNEVFSINKALGDISFQTGYQQAYIIQNGRTVLGDGGGVCQVSTTLFRAVLNTGLPVVERHAHAYRVGYYEQDAGPGLDATIYAPTVDLKFKNDTGNYVLIQNAFDPVEQRLSFLLYGTKDEREVKLSKPVILSQSPAPEPQYQDDPTLPKGEIKQIDFAASGANTYFTREVKKKGKVIISEKFVSNFQPWKAVYLRGTKE